MGRSRKAARAGETHTIIVDRWLDDDTASAELDGDLSVSVPRALLPGGASPDIVLRVERGAARVTITIDEEATEAARRESEQLSTRLRRRDPGGDVVL
jgi:DUF3006 family protein